MQVLAPRSSPRRVGEPWQFQAVPRWIYLLAGVGALFILLPLFGMVAQVDWAAFIPLISSESSMAALGLSLRTATASTLLCIIFGVPLALVLARARFRGQGVLRALILLPLVVPPVVGGLALLYTFGRVAWIGQTFSTFGIDIAFSTTAVVLAQAFVALPFLVLSLEGSLRTAGQKYEAVAATLGARPSTVLRRITLPSCCPVWSRERCWRSLGAWENLVPHSPSPGAFKASPALCRWKFTFSARQTPMPPWPSPSS